MSTEAPTVSEELFRDIFHSGSARTGGMTIEEITAAVERAVENQKQDPLLNLSLVTACRRDETLRRTLMTDGKWNTLWVIACEIRAAYDAITNPAHNSLQNTLAAIVSDQENGRSMSF